MRIREVITYEDGKALAEIALASTETKPTDGLATGSTITEADTGKTFVLDEDSATWTEYTSGGGGGGGSSWTLLHEEDIEVSTTSTTATLVKTISLPEAWTGDMLFIQVKDKQGPRNGYFYQTLTFIQNVNAENQTTTTYNSFFPAVISKANDIWTVKIDRYGIYPLEVSNGGNIPIYARYNSANSKAIDSTYTVSIYKLSLPDGTPSPFA